MGHSSLEATEPSEARVWKGEPKRFLSEVKCSWKTCDGVCWLGDRGRTTGRKPNRQDLLNHGCTNRLRQSSIKPYRASRVPNIKTSIRTIFSSQSNGSPRPHVPQTPTIRKGNQTRLRFDPGARKLATPQPHPPVHSITTTTNRGQKRAQT